VEGGAGVEMAQTMYAHMNNPKINKEKKKRKKL
jgi:hypothetical protein